MGALNFKVSCKPVKSVKCDEAKLYLLILFCHVFELSYSLTGATVHVLCFLENYDDFIFRPLNPVKPIT